MFLIVVAFVVLFASRRFGLLFSPRLFRPPNPASSLLLTCTSPRRNATPNRHEKTTTKHTHTHKKTLRDPRGFAVKFYTREGNWDLVGNNMPVFFIRDGMKFPDMVRPDGLRSRTMFLVSCLFFSEREANAKKKRRAHPSSHFRTNTNKNAQKQQVHALKPNPKSHIQEGWRIADFFSHHPESLVREDGERERERGGRRGGRAALSCVSRFFVLPAIPSPALTPHPPSKNVPDPTTNKNRRRRHANDEQTPTTKPTEKKNCQ